MGVIAKGILRGYQGLFTPVPLGYPLLVFNKNSTLKQVTRPPGGPTGPRWNCGPTRGLIKLEVSSLGGSGLSCHK